jgi:hypothetical protein
MTRPSSWRILATVSVVLSLSACTTVQTTYFRVGYQELLKADHPALQRYEGTPAFTMVEDMTEKSLQIYSEGYVMLGYSQFVSPLLTGLAESYSTKWGAELHAAQVVLETPQPGPSNLHYFLVTYWAHLKPEQFSFGGYFSDLPDELLQRIGKDLNMVVVEQVIPDTPAADAGLRPKDVILAVDGERVLTAKAFAQHVHENRGKEVRMSVSRHGKTREIPVRLAATSLPAAPEDKGTIRYLVAPWRNTEPTDWSQWSIAALTSQAIHSYQRYEQQRQLAYARARAQAQHNLDYLDSVAEESTSRRGAGRAHTSRRAGGAPQPQTGATMAISFQDQQRAMQQLKDFGRSWGQKMDRQRQENVQVWLNNAPNAYSQMGRWSVP